MSIVKSLVLSAALGLSTMAYVAPAMAATPAEVQDLVDQRVAQLLAQRAALEAQLTVPGVTPAQRIEIVAQIQQTVAQLSQLQGLGPQLPGLPGAVLESVAEFLQAQISAA